MNSAILRQRLTAFFSSSGKRAPSRRASLRVWGAAACVLALVAAGWIGLAGHYRLSAADLGPQLARVVLTRPLAIWHQGDLEYVREETASYWHGSEAGPGEGGAIKAWHEFSRQNRQFELKGYVAVPLPANHIPHVFEDPNAPHLAKLRLQENLEQVISGAEDEYDAMLRLAGWVGSLFDHGVDPPPGGSKVDNVAAVVAAGKRGARFWCEIAARTMTHSATALGWTSRLVTVSHDGYDWSHAVTELWSNQYRKWFAIDTDFNVIFESEGVPLSAYELVHRGRDLQREGKLVIRQIAPMKPFFVARYGTSLLTRLSKLDLYAYAHIDMRNDWASRKLPRGSPAGGDLATWRTESIALGSLLTAIPRVDEEHLFNWPVNGVEVIPRTLDPVEQGFRLALETRAYSPYFRRLEVAVDEQAWSTLEPGPKTVLVPHGAHRLRFRVVTENGGYGPETIVSFELAKAGESTTTLSY